MITATVALGGCYVSLQPLLTDDVRVYEPKLVGTWDAKDDKDDIWTFTPAGEKAPRGYNIEIVEDGRAAQFSGELARLDGLLVLDLELADSETPDALLDDVWTHMHVVGVHSFVRIILEGDSLTLS